MNEKVSTIIERIQQKLNIAGKKIDPPLPLSEIEKFEHIHQIVLPEEYREFLLKVGNGGEGPPQYGLLPLGKALNGLDDLSKPFPFIEEWVWESESNPNEELIKKVGHGRLILGDEGCARYWALIVNGPQRGFMWDLADVGIQPCVPARNFLSWYEYWLDGHDDWWAGL